MARPQKSGLDYFALDVVMSDEVEIIEAKHGLEGFAILIKLYQKIYSEGYFIEWNEKQQLLFSNRVSSDRNKVVSIVSDCIEWGIFNKDKACIYGILTSRRIQNHYFSSVYKRVNVEAIKEYLLIDIDGKKNINMISITDDINEDVSMVSDIGNEDVSMVSDDKSTQSKVKESKEDINIDDYEEFFEKLWKLYPKKRGKGSVSKTQKKKLFKIGYDKMVKAIELYKKEREGEDPQFTVYGSTFFNSRYIDYLTEAEEKAVPIPKQELKFVPYEVGMAEIEEENRIKAEAISKRNEGFAWKEVEL